MLTFTTALPAMLAEEPGNKSESEAHTDIRLTKELVYPQGATLPSMAFQFEAEYKGFMAHDGGSTDGGLIPAIAISNLTFDQTTLGQGVGGVNTAIKQSNNLLKDSSGNLLTFEKAGIYTYEIKETPSTVSLEEGENLDYDPNIYQLFIYTKNTPDSNKVEIEGGIVWIDNGPKVDPSPQVKPGETIITQEDNVQVEKANGFKFTNRYRKLAGGKDGIGLYVNNYVVGDYADLNKVFTFHITIKADRSSQGEEISLLRPDAPMLRNIRDEEKVTIGNQDHTFRLLLKHGETVQLKGAQVGTTVTVAEEDPSPYLVDIEPMVNGVKGNKTVNSQTFIWSGQLGEKRNQVDYTNHYDLGPATGIIIDNLPYLLLVALAVGGIVFFIVSRRNNKEDKEK